MATTLTFGQLESLWVGNGGDPNWAPTMAGIAFMESGGNYLSVQQGQPYATTGWGLWQITPGNSEPKVGTDNQLLDQNLNAQAALAKFASQGIGAWAGDPVGGQSVGGQPVPFATVLSIVQRKGFSTADAVPAAQVIGYPAGGTSAATLLNGSFDVNSLVPIHQPPPGMDSNISTGSFFINGQSVNVDVSAALTNIGIEYDITQASTLTMTLEDPNRTIINNPAFSQASAISLLSSAYTWQLVSVEKASNVVTAIFEPWVVAALRSAPTRRPFSVAPGQLTRSQFATVLIKQIQGATAAVATTAFIATTPTTNGQPPGITQESLCRGTVDNIYEDSWTCLQRLASEVQWVCFEYNTVVYFGPQEYLAEQAAFPVQEFQNGVLNIDGTYDTGQPLGTATIDALAGTWMLGPGQAVAINNLGPFGQNASALYTLNPDQPVAIGQNWIVATVARANVFNPDIIITLQQALPSLAEPATGGASAAVGVGQPLSQSATGITAAQTAIAYAIAQLGKPYVWGGENPNSGFDCSGLMQAAYASAGVVIPRVAADQQSQGSPVPPGGSQLQPGDLVFFGALGVGATHVGMFISYDAATNTATMINAEQTGTPIKYDTFTPDVGAKWGAGVYLGATTPSP